MNHAVLLVGYGKAVNQYNGLIQEYLIIKNSFGKTWGESGFAKIGINSDNKLEESLGGVCGILKEVWATIPKL